MISKHEAKHGRAALLAIMIGLSVSAAPGAVAAQSSESDGQSAPSLEQPATVQKLQEQRQKIQQLAGELRQIQQQAAKSNPELRAEQIDYRDLVFDAMKGKNFDPESEIQDMRSLQSELQSGGDLPKSERQAKLQELQKKQQKFRNKQQQAMQDEDVQRARQLLDEKMRKAMMEQNPQVEEMLAELNELQKEYRTLLKKMQQGSMQAPQG